MPRFTHASRKGGDPGNLVFPANHLFGKPETRGAVESPIEMPAKRRTTRGILHGSYTGCPSAGVCIHTEDVDIR